MNNKFLVASVWLVYCDRSGAADNGSRGITAMLWHTEYQPLIIGIYLTKTELAIAVRREIIIEIGKLIFDEYVMN